MKYRTVRNMTDDAYCGSRLEAQGRYNLGARSIRELAEKANARIQIGRSVRYNFRRMDEYLESVSEGGNDV